MAANAPEIVSIADSDRTVVVLINGYYNAATTGNTKVVQANNYRGANTSLGRFNGLAVAKVDYIVSTANGFVSLEFMGSSNVKFLNLGGKAAGQFHQHIPNFAPAPSGDINLSVTGMANNDSYSIVLTLRKDVENSNGWANLYNNFQTS